MSPVKSGPHSELFFFLIRKEPGTLTMPVEFKPFVPAETLRACALIGLHLMAAEGEAGSSGSQSPVLGDMWSKVAQKAQIGTATDTFSPDKFSPITCKVRFSTLCSQKSDEERPSLSDHDSSLLLEDWELPRLPWITCARKCIEAWLLACRCQESPLSQQRKPCSYRGRAVTKERSVVRNFSDKLKLRKVWKKVS